jgi:hypothetical protein
VFSQWRRMLRLAAWVTADVFARAGLRAAFFTGEETQRRRTENIVAFHDDPDTRVLFATDAGGVGLNLQRAASCVINLDLPWNPAVLEQRIGRIFRLGQTQPVDIYNLVAAGGIEDRIAGLVGDKRALFVGLFDGSSDEVTFDSAGSFMTRVHELIRPELPAIDAEVAAAEDAADDAVDRPEASLDPDEEIEATPAPEAAVAATPADLTGDATTAQANLDVGDLASWMSGIQVRQLEGGRVALELPRSAATALGGLLRTLAAAVEGPPSPR